MQRVVRRPSIAAYDSVYGSRAVGIILLYVQTAHGSGSDFDKVPAALSGQERRILQGFHKVRSLG